MLSVGGRTLTRIVVSTNTAKELLVSQFPTKHVQNPGALLIVVSVQKFEEIFGLRVVYWRSRLFLVAEIGLGFVTHVLPKGRLALVALNEKSSEILSKALAEPEVRPGRLGNRIAKPLVRYFMRDHIHEALPNFENSA